VCSSWINAGSFDEIFYFFPLLFNFWLSGTGTF
jgi:hypothetical protein